MARNRYSDDEAEARKLDFSILRRLLKYILPYKKQFFSALALLVVSVLISLIWPILMRWNIDTILTAGSPEYGNYKLGIGVTAAVGVLLILDVFLSARRTVMVSKLGHNAIFDIRKELFEHIQSLSFKYFDDRPAGKILVRVTNYIDSLATLLSGSLLTLIVDAATLLTIIVIMFSMNVKLTLVSFCILIPLSIFIVFNRRLAAKFIRRMRTKASNRTAYMHENIMGVFVTQAFTREKVNNIEMRRLDDDVNAAVYKQTLVLNSLGPAIDLFSTIGIILVYLLGCRMIADTNDMFTLGELVAFTAYLSRFWAPIQSFAVIFNQFNEATGNIERIFETMDTEPDICDLPDAQALPEIQGRVDFEDITFSYDGKNNILKNLSFTALPGQMLALIGPTGAGKTTIVNLLSRFYDPSDGRVLIDGHDIKHVTTDSLRTQVSVMMQDTFIFSGNIIENIRYGRPDATDDECIAAAQEVYASDFIEQLPNGYYSKVNERGAGLSTGERQLLSFARTVLANPRILILDEATSNIDTETELLIQRALSKLLKGRTSFVIAHRLSTIRHADRIMCIANQTIAEEGTHEELMAKQGFYYELIQSQYKAILKKEK